MLCTVSIFFVYSGLMDQLWVFWLKNSWIRIRRVVPPPTLYWVWRRSSSTVGGSNPSCSWRRGDTVCRTSRLSRAWMRKNRKDPESSPRIRKMYTCSFVYFILNFSSSESDHIHIIYKWKHSKTVSKNINIEFISMHFAVISVAFYSWITLCLFVNACVCLHLYNITYC